MMDFKRRAILICNHEFLVSHILVANFISKYRVIKGNLGVLFAKKSKSLNLQLAVPNIFLFVNGIKKEYNKILSFVKTRPS